MVGAERRYVIYGASGGGRKVFHTLRNTGIDIDFFVDGNPEKWGSCFEGKLVREPEAVEVDRHFVVIASELNQEKIEERLEELGLSQNIIMKEQILLPYALGIDVSQLYDGDVPIHEKEQVYIELLEGTPKGFGGMTGWSIDTAFTLQRNGISSHILASAREPYPEGKEMLFQTFETSYENYWEDVMKLANYLKNQLPCILLLNKQTQLLYAGILLKKMYPEQIKMISVIHSDAVCLYKRSALIADYADEFLCTTKLIREELTDKYHIPFEKTAYKEMPVGREFYREHNYSCSGEPIYLAYAGRLARNQKRADLLPVLFDMLEEKGIEYRFYIAGVGECQMELWQYIKKKHMENRIIQCGLILREDMPEFWEDKDVFIALSDREGTNLSMIEAMAAGAVPVVTKYASAVQFVEEPENGFVVGFDDIQKMADTIEMLYSDRKRVKELGQKASTYIRRHCGADDYEKFIVGLCSTGQEKGDCDERDNYNFK